MTANKIIILDGGMGRELGKRGAPFKQPEWSALAMMDAPEIVKEVHKDFIVSGASIIMTNSYALVPFHIGEDRFNDQAMSLAADAGRMARAAVNETQTSTLVAGSIPPLFGSYRADLYQPNRVDEIAMPLIEGLVKYVDLWICEIQSLIDEPLRIKSLIDKLDSHVEEPNGLNKCKKTFWVSFTLDDSASVIEPLLRSGESVVDAVTVMVDAKVDAILFNCCQPEVIRQAIKVTQHKLAELKAENIKIGAYANAFPSQNINAVANTSLNKVRDDLTPSSYLQWAQQWVEDGATLIGGCCGIGPEHIAVLAEKLDH